MTTQQRIDTVLEAELGPFPTGVDELTPETKLIEDLGADSLDLVEVSLGLEEEFGTALEDDIEKTWDTVGDVYRAMGVEL